MVRGGWGLHCSHSYKMWSRVWSFCVHVCVCSGGLSEPPPYSKAWCFMGWGVGFFSSWTNGTKTHTVWKETATGIQVSHLWFITKEIYTHTHTQDMQANWSVFIANKLVLIIWIISVCVCVIVTHAGTCLCFIFQSFVVSHGLSVGRSGSFIIIKNTHTYKTSTVIGFKQGHIRTSQCIQHKKKI